MELISAKAEIMRDVQATVEEARAFHDAARSSATRRAYTSDWAHFTRWCELRGFLPLPAAAEVIVLYITELARSHKPSTIGRRLVAISQAHKEAELDSPTKSALVSRTLKGIHNTKGTAPTQKRAAEVEVIRRMIKTFDGSLVGLRARAILLLGFAGAFRRSELAGLTIADLEEVAEGMIVTLRKSKSDQAGAGAFKPIAYGDHPETCPIRALRAWLTAAGITDGPIFRPFKRNGQVRDIAISGHAINAIVKEAAEAAGYAPKDFGGHSLRSGFATTAAKIGASEKDIMDVTGHRSTTMLRRYIRRGSLFQNNATKVGL